MFGALLDRFSEIELTGTAEWAGAGPAHNVGASLDQLPVRLHAGVGAWPSTSSPWRDN